MKHYKCMVNLKDFSLIVHCLDCNIMTPVFLGGENWVGNGGIKTL